MNKNIYKIKIYITEDGYFRGEAWEIAEKVEFKNEFYVLDGIDEDGDYIYRKEQS